MSEPRSEIALLPDEVRGEMIDALLGARSVLSEPGVWCQNAQAKRPLTPRYADGPVMWGSRWSHPDAEQFCLLGAVCITTRRNATGHPVHKLLGQLLRRRFGWQQSVPRWNDDPERTLPQVLGLIDTALDELKGADYFGSSAADHLQGGSGE